MTASKLLLGLVLAGYPLIVYLLLDEVGPAMLGIILVVIMIIRSIILKRHAPAMTWGMLALAAIAIGLLIFDDTAIVLKMYPTLINLGLLTAFGYTLFFPPSMIERFVRAMNIPIHAKTTSYTRVVTMIWCGFFAINSIVATLVTFSGSLGAWTLYNGLISYLIMGSIMVVEYIFRYFYKRHHGLLTSQLEASARNNNIETTH